ncbi:hypothetical protein [Dyadobacter sp. Leaf189]|uniref:hypothetical protein n=1 Tax=Dyadobacter sp. Leaf189 TaxID=1736295 RepID=UPI0012FA4598|nr:hypothetical protein [Dyadobacter sp. Leaf189]
MSLLLFGLLLYNTAGYSVVYLLEETPAMSGGGGNYAAQGGFGGDIVIKVPVNVPYQVSWDNAEPVEGEIRHKGLHYQMKTKQLINDTLYVHCEFDQNARDRYTALVSRIQDEIAGARPQKGPRSVILKSFLKDYLANNRKHIFYILEWIPAGVQISDNYLLSAGCPPVAPLCPPPDQA